MRRGVTAAHCGLILFAALPATVAPPAAADPPTPGVDAPPEVPADQWRTVFAENPMILNPHVTTVESWTRTGDGLAVNFTAGPAECFGVHATVEETAEEVTVNLDSGVPPEAIGRMCIALAVPGTLDIALDRPLGDRVVLTAGTTLDKPR
ncbi:hypothetical protein L2K20_27200 [Mycobacterium sp. MBM]|nr:hypothetical protein [Mycobacterium sp. MBM]